MKIIQKLLCYLGFYPSYKQKTAQEELLEKVMLMNTQAQHRNTQSTKELNTAKELEATYTGLVELVQNGTLALTKQELDVLYEESLAAFNNSKRTTEIDEITIKADENQKKNEAIGLVSGFVNILKNSRDSKIDLHMHNNRALYMNCDDNSMRQFIDTELYKSEIARTAYETRESNCAIVLQYNAFNNKYQIAHFYPHGVTYVEHSNVHELITIYNTYLNNDDRHIHGYIKRNKVTKIVTGITQAYCLQSNEHTKYSKDYL